MDRIVISMAILDLFYALDARQEKQEGAAVEGPSAMGPSLQLSTDRRRERPLPW